VKEFRSEEIFKKELKNLRITQALDHANLIKYYFTCTKERIHYVVFPWAEGGNLREYWKAENSRRSAKLYLWTLQQMRDISSALMALHGVNFRHGDLKPENILHFDEGENARRLVLADVGVSRVHETDTKMRHAATTTRATTPSYESPEVHLHEKVPRSRKYDAWSIGCIFLEFIIWLLHDLDTINRFGKARDGPEFPFYRITGRRTASLHPVVSRTMETLRQDPRCQGATAIGTLINLIDSHLLLVEVEDRYTAEQLYKVLQRIVRDAERNPAYIRHGDYNSTPKRLDF
jgi:serine/threonine protein kinase